MAKHFTYKWAEGCTVALISGPGIAYPSRMSGIGDEALGAMMHHMSMAYEAGLRDGAEITEAVNNITG